MEKVNPVTKLKKIIDKLKKYLSPIRIGLVIK